MVSSHVNDHYVSTNIPWSTLTQRPVETASAIGLWHVGPHGCLSARPLELPGSQAKWELGSWCLNGNEVEATAMDRVFEPVRGPGISDLGLAKGGGH